MIHLYCGSGKGKTTAAMGLALRCIGRGGRVVVAQFLKGADSGERQALAQLPQVTLLPVPAHIPFTFAMTDTQRSQEQARYRQLLEQAAQEMGNCQLLVLDEVCDGVNEGLVELEQLLSLLDTARCEVVLTGRDPHPDLADRAHYYTQMEKVRHPFDRGICARPGIEF